MSENNLPPVQPERPRRRSHRSFFWPIMLISLGVLLLLSNLGIVAWSTWNLLWRFWPLILVAVGVDVLFGQRSALGAVISAFLILAIIGAVAGAIFFADNLPFLNNISDDSSWNTSHLQHELDDYESANIFIDWTSPPGSLYALSSSDSLIEGDITYQGELIFDVDQRGDIADVNLDTRMVSSWTPSFQGSPRAKWEIGLTPEIPLDLSLDSGSGSCDFDLSELIIDDLYLDSGSGSIRLALPEDQSFQFELDSGSGSVQIDLPEETGVRVDLDSGSGSFNPGNNFDLVSGERRGDGVWESENYDSAKFTIEITIDQGSGSISFK